MGKDVLAWRKKFGVIGPSTNTVVQPDMEQMRPPGVTNHYSRIYTPNAKALDDQSAWDATQVIASNVVEAVKSIMTCEPDYLVMGMSAITFFGGRKGAMEFAENINRESGGIGCSIGSLSCTAALKAYGGVKRISFLSPYYPISNKEVRQYFTDEGFEVINDIPLRAKSWTGIAEITEDTLRATLKQIDGDNVDALVQVGTNCSMVRLAAATELVLNKPVIAINTATYWHALRTSGIRDKVYGLGRLLEEF
ncbi:MAG: arylmalonate decarboxylase [Rhodobacteraceae bacterium]|nr:arylmalonate decarboxylase [Paracoccaceae bacterium]